MDYRVIVVLDLIFAQDKRERPSQDALQAVLAQIIFPRSTTVENAKEIQGDMVSQAFEDRVQEEFLRNQGRRTREDIRECKA